MPTFKAITYSITYGYFYFRRASASFLLVGSYPTSWGKKDSNFRCFQCHGFTDRCNRRYAHFPKFTSSFLQRFTGIPVDCFLSGRSTKWIGTDLNRTWLVYLPPSKLLATADYLTAIVSAIPPLSTPILWLQGMCRVNQSLSFDCL